MKHFYRGQINKAKAFGMLCIVGVAASIIWASSLGPLTIKPNQASADNPTSPGLLLDSSKNNSGALSGSYSIQGSSEKPTELPVSAAASSLAVPSPPATPLAEPPSTDPICGFYGTKISCLICPDTPAGGTCGCRGGFDAQMACLIE